MRVVYQGQTIQLNDRDALGSGGEATVIQHRNLAFKIYHKPTVGAAKKLQYFLQKGFSLPKNVAAPIDLVQNPGGKIVGFTMRIAKNATEFMKLSNKKYRTQNQVDSNQVVDAFVHAKMTLDQVHEQQLVVGDLNDLNLLFNDQFQTVFIDVDSYQFDTYPCPVGTDTFIDPQLIGIDLSKKPSFSKESDWYSFAVMLFKSLLLVHPYGGMHKQYKKMFDRIQHHVTVFDADVVYPKIGLPPETLDDSLLGYFDRIFRLGQREDLPLQMLKQMANSFICCSSCGMYHSKARAQCPGCQKVLRQPTVDLSAIVTAKTVAKGQCYVDTVFEDGNILFTKVVRNKLVVVAYDGTQTNLHIIGPPNKKFKLWRDTLRHAHFGFFSDYLVVAHGTDLMIFDTSGSQLEAVVKTKTGIYREEPVFACDDENVYRLTDNYIMRCQVHKKSTVDTPVCSSMENQTWISVGPNGLGLGFYKIFDKYQYFVFSSKGRFEVTLSKLPGHLIEYDVQFSANQLVLLRKTIDQGRTYSHYNIIDDHGLVLEQRSELSLNSEFLRNIFGKQLVGSCLVHPTDAGIVMEKHGSAELKAATADYVDNGCSLALYKKGILVISERKVQYLELR